LLYFFDLICWIGVSHTLNRTWHSYAREGYKGTQER
jgi:hypothetical protein